MRTLDNCAMVALAMNKLLIITQLARLAAGNEQAKAQFKTLAMKALRRIAKELDLPKGSFDVRFNAGGPAVSGDAILHHDEFYLTIGEFGVMWRTCKGRKDYTGGPNRWAIGFGSEQTEVDLCNAIRREVVTVAF